MVTTPGTRRGRAPTLRTYLGALIVLFVLAELIETAYVRGRSEDAARVSAAANARFSAELAASEITSALSSLEASVARTAANPGIAQAFDQPTCSLVFGTVGLFQSTHLDLLRPDGSVNCSSAPNLAPGTGYPGASWLASALRTPTFAAPIVDPRAGRRSAVSAAPVGSRGVVAGFVDLSGLGPALAARFGGPAQLEFLITSSDGATVVGRSIEPERWAGASLPTAPFQVPADTADHPDLDGVSRIYGQSPVAARGWIVFAGVRSDNALAASSGTVLSALQVDSVMLLVLLIATLVVYRAITYPLWRLARSVRSETTSGRLGAVPVSGPREIAELARDFNRLIATAGAELAEREQAEAQARGMLDASLDGVIAMDDQGFIVEWNERAATTFGWSREEAVGTRLATLIIPERYRARHVEGLARYLRTGEGPVLGKRIELEALARDGHELPVELSIAPMPTSSGQMFSASVRDLTERRASEQVRDTLEARLRQSERLESVGRLVGGIAHDFNNLLAIVLNYSDFIARRLPPGDPNQDDLLQIRAAGERATRLTRQLLTFARRGPVHPEDLSLNVLIEQISDLLRRSMTESITIDLRLAEELSPIYADHGQLEQLLLNLVVNAGDAMPTGGRLVIATTNIEFDADSAGQQPDLRPGRYVQLTVTDTGVGMTQDVLDRAFEPFFTTKAKGKGTGLGLATTYGVVQQAAGRISLYSEVGKGTTVHVLLPASTAAKQPVPARAAPRARPDRERGMILVVEDEDRVREAAARILAAAGYDVVQSDRPDAALTLMGDPTRSLDLLLTDMVMPGMSGRELARRLREQRPGLRVIFMTGYSEELMQHEAGLPDDTVVHKPFTREPLLSAVSTALGTGP
jgi:PAS domain S-box-containing protein